MKYLGIKTILLFVLYFHSQSGYSQLFGGGIKSPLRAMSRVAMCDGSQPTKIVGILSLNNTGLTWMDRDLGARRKALKIDDEYAYGCQYQWGRGNDGHASIDWATHLGVTGTTTTTMSTDAQAGMNQFVVTTGGNYDWRVPQNGNLWQGVTGTNNPCPSGYRLPTETELKNEMTYYYNNKTSSPIVFVYSGHKVYNGVILGAAPADYNSPYGEYMTSTIDNTNARRVTIWEYTAWFRTVTADSAERGVAAAVRCVTP